MILLWLAFPAWVLSGAELPARAVWSAPDTTVVGSPSPDGRWLSCVDASTGDLALREIATGAMRRLTRKPPGSKEFAYFSVISPDGRQVAYAWSNDAGFYDLRIAAADGSSHRVVFRNEEAGFVQPSAWTPDGGEILTLLFRRDNISQIAMVAVASGQVRVLKSLEWVYPKRMDISPDGNWVAYDAPSAPGSHDRDVFLLATDGSRQHVLVRGPSEDLFPMFAPDGRHVVFASDRLGSLDAFAVPVTGGEPRLLRRGLGRILPMGITRAGDLYYGLRIGDSEVVVAPLEGSAPAVRMGGGASAPAWSRDGDWLAWLARRGTENYGQESRVVCLRSLTSGEHRELDTRMAHIERLQWSHDGRALLAQGSDGRGRPGLFRLDAASGATRALLLDDAAGFRGVEAVWLGETLIHAQQGLRAGERVLYAAAQPVRLLAASWDATRLAFMEGNDLVVLPATGGKPLLRYRQHGVTALDWAGDLLLIAGADGVWLLSLQQPLKPRRVNLAGYEGGSFRVSPDGRRVAFTRGRTRSEVWVLPAVTATLAHRP